MVQVLLNHFSIDQKPIHGSDRKSITKRNLDYADPKTTLAANDIDCQNQQ